MAPLTVGIRRPMEGVLSARNARLRRGLHKHVTRCAGLRTIQITGAQHDTDEPAGWEECLGLPFLNRQTEATRAVDSAVGEAPGTPLGTGKKNTGPLLFA